MDAVAKGYPVTLKDVFKKLKKKGFLGTKKNSVATPCSFQPKSTHKQIFLNANGCNPCMV